MTTPQTPPGWQAVQVLAALGHLGVVYTHDSGWQLTDTAGLLEQFPMADDDQIPGEKLTMLEPVVTRRRWPDERLAPCGTPSAFKRHKARGEAVDQACRDAIRDYDRDRKRRQRNHPSNRQLPLMAIVHPQTDSPDVDAPTVINADHMHGVAS